MSKINLGCGNDVRLGYLNVDLRQTHSSVKVVDLSKFPWPLESEAFDEALMLDFLEHFPYRKTNNVLLEANRILRVGGELVIQVPDTEQLTQALLGVGQYHCNRCEKLMQGAYSRGLFSDCPHCLHTGSLISEAAMMRLYGGQDYEGNFHYTCFTRESLQSKVGWCGFDLVGYEEEEHQARNWNFKARFRKKDPWTI